MNNKHFMNPGFKTQDKAVSLDIKRTVFEKITNAKQRFHSIEFEEGTEFMLEHGCELLKAAKQRNIDFEKIYQKRFELN